MIAVDQLYALVNQLPFAANVRDIETGKFTIANELQALNHGFLNANAMIGMNLNHFFEHRLKKLSNLQGSLEYEKKYQHFIYEANKITEAERTPKEFILCALFPTGFIYISTLKKIPIVSENGQVTKMLTFSQETTPSMNLLSLYHLYKEHYLVQAQAITQFLKYLNILGHFSRLPTNQEVTTLLMLRRSSISKYAARQLKISYRTIEEYKARLRNKLKSTSLDDLLISLRMRSEKMEEKTILNDLYSEKVLYKPLNINHASPFYQTFDPLRIMQVQDSFYDTVSDG